VREYEFTFIVQPEISEEGLRGICDRFERVLEKHGSTRLCYDDWGRRRLAYEIQKFQKGHYLVLYFLDDGKVVPEIERAAKIDDSILRYLTVLVNEQVDDVEARVAEAAELEQERLRKAAERTAREAEEAQARAAEAAKADAAAALEVEEDSEESEQDPERDDDDEDDDEDDEEENA